MSLKASWDTYERSFRPSCYKSSSSLLFRDLTHKMKINTLEAAKLLGIKPTQLRLLMRKGKIKAPPIVFDSETNSIGRM